MQSELLAWPLNKLVYLFFDSIEKISVGLSDSYFIHYGFSFFYKSCVTRIYLFFCLQVSMINNITTRTSSLLVLGMEELCFDI